MLIVMCSVSWLSASLMGQLVCGITLFLLTMKLLRENYLEGCVEVLDIYLDQQTAQYKQGQKI